ncbi:efflux RND transporter periplasmic adaptor subunit [Streptomyces paludis]|uniref:Peptidoglycan-binding protein n=1 Tax=Streptomyces paludis TaxID=2282738 RepID=A0A345HNG3_9ACTN|nr:HlyD family efflux transporter periplasmic adaptor subunit [Streptomyces paludis]AXG78237.1 hypothetical protein DVK44_11570 [Streptomyces paludis]
MSGGSGAPGTRRRARIIAATSLVALLVTGAAGAAVWSYGSGRTVTAGTASDPSAQTATVTRTDLSNSRTLDGTLGYGRATTVRANATAGANGGGTVTWLPADGTEVTRGKALYRVDDRPVSLLYGDLPLYRRLDTLNTVGRDVRMLAENLVALGYTIGNQPLPGQTVNVRLPDPDPDQGAGADEAPSRDADRDTDPSPDASTPATGGSTAPPTTKTASPSYLPVKVGPDDGVLTQELIDAVKRWQTYLGVPATGVIDASDIAVLKGAVRVDSVQVQTGDPADGPMLKATTTGKAVTLSMEATESGGIKRGQRVTVHLPDESTVPGKVSSVATTAEPAGAEQGPDAPPMVTVTVTLDNEAKARKFDSAPVRVDFAGESRSNVLTVPVTALLSLREGGYGVQLANGKLIAVTTGLFSKGQVEVSGDGLAEGARVVVAS